MTGNSGTNFNRPQFKQMISDIEDGKIDIVITKDLSRLGREYLRPDRISRYSFLPITYGILPLTTVWIPQREITNFSVSRISSTNSMQRISPRRFVPHGKRLPSKESIRHLLRHMATKRIPKTSIIFLWTKIPRPLSRECFKWLWRRKNTCRDRRDFHCRKNINTKGIRSENLRYLSNGIRIPAILMTGWVTRLHPFCCSKPYIGTLVNHRRTSKSFKNKKIIQIPEDEWIEVENTHEAIIDRETWDIVQKMVAVKKRPNKDGVSQIFAGLVKCPDCGRALSYKSEHTRILRVALSTITPRTKARNTVLGTISHTKLCTKLF